MDNPFAGLELPKSLISDKEVRDALPDDVVTATRKLIIENANPDLKAIWRLLEGTGCRLAEITGLRVQDISTEGGTPHIKIVAHEARQLKNASSKRDVPLVGDALAIAKEIVGAAKDNTYAFPRYSGPTGPNTASQSLMKWLRKVTDNPLHAVHSLRHNMADRCDLAGVHPTDKEAILGHLNVSASEKHYGSEAAKRVRLKRAMERACGLNAPSVDSAQDGRVIA
nr:tyrosine-type recombinase/integrase [Rhizobium sp. BK538]